jgi:4'-phosphopantetheinyl transferase EntD
VNPNHEPTNQAIRRDLPSEVAFAGGAIEGVYEKLFPVEEAVILRAVAKRRDEFAAGRAYARRALEALGIDRVAIPADPERVPVWPAGIAGSISHCAEYCAAVVASSNDFAGIGFDVEPDDAVEDDLVATICSPPDLVATRELGVRAPRLVFCIKESVYKAYFPLARTFLNFNDVAVESAAEGAFTARLMRDGLPSAAGLRTFHGRFVRADGIVAAWTLLRA